MQSYFDKKPFHWLMNSGWTTKPTPLMSNVFWMNSDIPLEPRPTRHDVLKAVSTISKYIDSMNEPIARKLEALLGSFNRQPRLDGMRGMESTVLMDFFERA